MCGTQVDVPHHTRDQLHRLGYPDYYTGRWAPLAGGTVHPAHDSCSALGRLWCRCMVAGEAIAHAPATAASQDLDLRVDLCSCHLCGKQLGTAIEREYPPGPHTGHSPGRAHSLGALC